MGALEVFGIERKLGYGMCFVLKRVLVVLWEL
jgi:hypothetical protein